MKKLLKTKDVLEILNIDDRTLRKIVREGKIQPVKLVTGTSSYRYDEEDVKRLIEDSKARQI